MAAIFLVTAGAAPMAHAPKIPALLVLDKDAILARYAGPKAALTRDMDEFAQGVAQREQAFVLKKSATLLYSPTADLSGDIERALDKTHSPRDSAPPGRIAQPLASRPLVLNRAFVKAYVRAPKTGSLDAEIGAQIPAIMRETGATVILDSKSVAIDLPVFDISGAVIARLNGKRFKLTYPQTLPVLMLKVNGTAIAMQSRVGKSIGIQVQYLVRAAQAEFVPRASEIGQAQAALNSGQPDPAAVAALEAKRQAYNDDIKARQKEIENAVAVASRKVEIVTGGLLEALMRQHGAGVLLDSGAVADAPAGLDLTGEAIAALDRALPDIKVELPPHRH